MKTIETLIKQRFPALAIVCLIALFFVGCEEENENKPGVTIPLPNPVINFNQGVTYGTMTDIDGNVYKTFTYNGKTWMAENLKVTRYRNGDPIPNVKDSTEWINLKTGAYCDYNNEPLISKVFGKLYNGYARNDSRNLAPEGWHIANQADWYSLLPSLPWNMGLIKESDTIHWKHPNISATNETGFTALPAGMRSAGFTGIYESCYYDETGTGSNLFSFSHNGTGRSNLMGSNPMAGISVRCVKD